MSVITVLHWWHGANSGSLQFIGACTDSLESSKKVLLDAWVRNTWKSCVFCFMYACRSDRVHYWAITVRRFDLEGLHQSQNCFFVSFGIDTDPWGRNILTIICPFFTWMFDNLPLQFNAVAWISIPHHVYRYSIICTCSLPLKCCEHFYWYMKLIGTCRCTIHDLCRHLIWF